MNFKTIANLNSFHIFLFPFRWRLASNSKSDFSTEIEANENWKKYLENEDRPIDFYNNAAFFSERIRPAVFEGFNFADRKIVKNYIYDTKGKKYLFKIKLRDNVNYELNLMKIRLNVYSSGVGVLSLHMSNTKFSKPEDVLRINDYGRRVFLQFLAQNENSEFQHIDHSTFAKELIIEDNDGSKIYYEDFSKYTKKSFIEAIKKNPDNFKYGPENLVNILGNNFTSSSSSSSSSSSGTKENKSMIQIIPTLDERLFGICWLGDDVESNRIKLPKESERPYSDFWLKFLFLEKYSTSQSEMLSSQLLEKHTYHRWLNYGTLYGATKSTFVCLSNSSDENKKMYCLPSIRYQYFDMVQLLLSQHASILKFSDELREYRLIVKESGDKQDLLNKAKLFHEAYLEFVDSIHFYTISPLEQGNELYQLIQKNLEISTSLKELEIEMLEFRNLINRIMDENREKMNHLFSFIAFIFLPASIITGIFGMETLGDFAFNFNGFNRPFFTSLLIIIAVPLIVAFCWRRFKGKI